MEMNYAQFYALLNRLPYDGDREELKEQLVYAASDGRTTSLRQLTRQEYAALVRDMEQRTGSRDEIRQQRSACLRLMQRLGVDTTSWDRVNALCRDSRIAGKEFARLSVDELKALQTKLRAIGRRGGLGRTAGSAPEPRATDDVSLMIMTPVGEA